MLPNLSIEKAQLLQQKLQDIKDALDQDIFTHDNHDVTITISVLGNIKQIDNPTYKNIFELIPIINEAAAKARQEYEIKQAHMLQKEMMNFM